MQQLPFWCVAAPGCKKGPHQKNRCLKVVKDLLMVGKVTTGHPLASPLRLVVDEIAPSTHQDLSF